MSMPQVPEYIGFGSYNASHVPVAVALTADAADNKKPLFAHGLKELHLDILYTPQAAQTTRFLEVFIKSLDEYGNVLSTKSTIVNGVSEIDVFTNRQSGMPIVVPGEKSESAGNVIKADYDCDINAYTVEISVRENDTGGTPAANFGSLFMKVRMFAKH